jgi:hypothetical protein
MSRKGFSGMNDRIMVGSDTSCAVASLPSK